LSGEPLRITSLQLHSQALLIRQQSIAYANENLDTGDDDFDSELHETGVDAQLLQHLIDKCPEYFTAALGWPDKEFRHEFRCESAPSTVYSPPPSLLIILSLI